VLALLLNRFSFLAVTAMLAGCSQSDVSLESRAINVDETAEPAGAVPQGVSRELVRETGPSYVTLTVSAISQGNTAKERDKRAVTSGSGFVVDDNGYVMTAAHVAVNKGNVVSARAANGRIYSGSVLDINPKNDMAIIKLKGFRGHAVAPVSNPCLAQGAPVFSLGKPHAQGDTARFGQIQSMSFGRSVQYGKFGYPDAMVMKMNTQKGESGGPVFDGQGRLAGMVVSTLSDGNGNPLNLAHAVPSSTLAGFLCTNISCTPNWSALAQAAGRACSQS
jgi:S1-C subfamily serine protease